MTNFFLFTYKFKWVLQNKKSNLQKARKFDNTFHFIGDLCGINDTSKFESYPKEQVLKQDALNLKASFLDLHINIKYREFETELYDKRDAFPFSIVRIIH